MRPLLLAPARAETGTEVKTLEFGRLKRQYRLHLPTTRTEHRPWWWSSTAGAAPPARWRVYATGISNGGFMCARLAIEASHRFAAIAPVAAGLPLDTKPDLRLPEPVSVMIVQGTRDPLVLLNTYLFAS